MQVPADCTTFLECSVPYLTSGSLFPYGDSSPPPYPGLLRIFGAAELWVDCAGVPLGPAVLDFCDVCGGDNSTCSGCDGIPNSVVDGIKLDKKCSGHGSCRSVSIWPLNKFYGLFLQKMAAVDLSNANVVLKDSM